MSGCRKPPLCGAFVSLTFLCSCRLEAEGHFLLHTEHSSFFLGSPATETEGRPISARTEGAPAAGFLRRPCSPLPLLLRDLGPGPSEGKCGPR